MRNTTSTITFDFNFRYPRHGIYEEANAVTVCEPSYLTRKNTRADPSTLRPHGLRKDMTRSRLAMGTRDRRSRMEQAGMGQSAMGQLEHRFLAMGRAAGTIRHMAVRNTWPTARCRVRS